MPCGVLRTGPSNCKPILSKALMIQSWRDGSELRPINQYPVRGVQRPGYTSSHVTPGFHSRYCYKADAFWSISLSPRSPWSDSTRFAVGFIFVFIGHWPGPVTFKYHLCPPVISTRSIGSPFRNLSSPLLFVHRCGYLQSPSNKSRQSLL